MLASVMRILLSMPDSAMSHNSWRFVKGFPASDDLVRFLVARGCYFSCVRHSGDTYSLAQYFYMYTSMYSSKYHQISSQQSSQMFYNSTICV